jgi:hypothetical protein
MSAPAKPSFWRSLRMVGWGLLGIRKNDEYKKDLAQVNPLHVVLAGFIAVLMLVVLLLAVVNWVVSVPTA